MFKLALAAAVALIMCVFLAGTSPSSAQPHLAESLLVHLDLSLTKGALASTNMVVRIHATDSVNDQYVASPVDPGQGTTVDWNQDLPLMVDSNVPLRLIFHIGDTSGSPLPAGYVVQWRYAWNSSAWQVMTGNSVTIPAGSTGDATLVVRGAVVNE